jgi:hypothetical protein
MRLTERNIGRTGRRGSLAAVVALVIATATLLALGTAMRDAGRMFVSAPATAPAPMATLGTSLAPLPYPRGT